MSQKRRSSCIGASSVGAGGAAGVGLAARRGFLAAASAGLGASFTVATFRPGGGGVGLGASALGASGLGVVGLGGVGLGGEAFGAVLLRFDGPAPEEAQAPLQSKVLEERESFDPDDPDLKPTTVAPAPREILALRSMSMSQLFRGGDEETNLEEGETTAASIQFEGADELPPEAMRAAKPTAPKVEAPKPTPPKVEAPKPAPPKVEAPKAEAPKPTSPPTSPPASPPPGRKVATVKEAPSPAAAPTKPKRAAKTPPAAPPSPAEEGQSPLDLRFWLIVAAVLMTSSVLGLSAGLWLLWSRG